MRGMAAISALASLAAPITDIRKRPYDGEALSSYQQGTSYALFRESGEGPAAALKNSVALQTHGCARAKQKWSTVTQSRWRVSLARRLTRCTDRSAARTS